MLVSYARRTRPMPTSEKPGLNVTGSRYCYEARCVPTLTAQIRENIYTSGPKPAAKVQRLPRIAQDWMSRGGRHLGTTIYDMSGAHREAARVQRSVEAVARILQLLAPMGPATALLQCNPPRCFRRRVPLFSGREIDHIPTVQPRQRFRRSRARAESQRTAGSALA